MRPLIPLLAIALLPATATAGGLPDYHDGKATIAAIKAAQLPKRIEQRLLGNATRILRRNPFNQPNDRRTWGHEIRTTGEIGGYRERTVPLFGKERIYVRTPTESTVTVRKGFAAGGDAFYLTHGQGQKDRIGNHSGKNYEYAVYKNDKGQLVESLRYRKNGQHYLRRDFTVDAAGKRTFVGQW